MLRSEHCPCSRCAAGTDHADRAHHTQLRALMRVLDERQRRWIAGAEATRLGYGGVSLVAQITGLDRKTICRGQRELAQGLADVSGARIRQPGAGRPPTEKKRPQLEPALMDLVRDEIAGDPSTGELWVRRSLAKLKRALLHRGFRVGLLVVRRLLRKHNIHARSKWNPIEHRLFSQISETWAGTPLTSIAILLDAIRHTTTTTGLRVRAQILPGIFSAGCTVTDEEMVGLSIEKHKTCPPWNYTVKPRLIGK
jgi:hypothetical protein